MTNTIGFPNLGIKLEINRVAFTIFSHSVYWYGIIIGIGFILAVMFALYRRKKYAVSADNIFDFVLIGLPSAIVGARLVYVLGDSSCRGDIMSIIAIWDGGLSIFGGLSFAVLSCLIYLKKKKMNILRTLDFAAPSFMIGQMIGRWGNFVNAEVYGRETNSFLKMSINSEPGVHPLFLYESLWMLIGFFALVYYSPKRKRNGEVFSLYLIWYGATRVWMEAMRDEEFVLKIFNLPLSQILAVLVILLGVFMLLYIYIKKPKQAMEKTIFAPGEFLEYESKPNEKLEEEIKIEEEIQNEKKTIPKNDETNDC